MNQDDINEIANQTVEETLDSLLFQSDFDLDEGMPCQCMVEKIHNFHSYLPDKLCGKTLDNLYKDAEEDSNPEEVKIKDFETKCEGLCPCQKAHFFTLKYKDNTFNLEESDDNTIMDKRKLRILPNHQ